MKKVLVITVFLLMALLVVPSLVLASSESITGNPEVVNTGGIVDFDNFNSNAVVDSETGAVTGYVWSEDIGWIDFSNNGESNPVTVNLSNGVVSGLAYVPNTGGFVDFTNYNSNVTWNSESGTLSGFGWSEDLGWIDFSGVLLTLPKTGQQIIVVTILASVLVVLGFVYLFKSDLKLQRHDF